MRRVLLIGATGAFGSRLARLLAVVPGIDVAVTSRSLDKAQDLARRLNADRGASGAVTGLSFTHNAGSAAKIAQLQPWLVIDAAGPFQSADYGTATATLQAGAHWIDLADAADYIEGFAPALHGLARKHGVMAAAGASSTPALSFAAVEALITGWRHVEAVDIGIYPAGCSAVGQAVLEAVLSYAGEPVAIWRDGALASTTGWGIAERLSLPGVPHRYRSPVATYDYVQLSRSLGVRNVAFHAGLESRLEHLGLTLLAQLRARRLIPRLGWLAPYLHKARHVTAPFCGDTGAMAVEARGVDASGRHIQAQWKLLAANGHGPNVPVLPALALTRKLLQAAPQSGAYCAAGLLSLPEIQQEMGAFAIATSSTSRYLTGARDDGELHADMAA